jgi:hypothetical protein
MASKIFFFLVFLSILVLEEFQDSPDVAADVEQRSHDAIDVPLVHSAILALSASASQDAVSDR